MKSTDPFGRRWRRHVKVKLGINVDLYSLKHLNTTELMDRLDKDYNPAKDVQKLTGHTSETMIAKVYDMNFKGRKDDKIKKAGRGF